MIAWTLGLAVIWSELAQRPMIERLRRGKRASPGDGWPAPLSPDHRRVVRFSVRRWYFMTDQ